MGFLMRGVCCAEFSPQISLQYPAIAHNWRYSAVWGSGNGVVAKMSKSALNQEIKQLRNKTKFLIIPLDNCAALSYDNGMNTTATQTPVMIALRDELRENIALTNNGYLFAPTPTDVYVATLYPKHFAISFAPSAKSFPFRITNK